MTTTKHINGHPFTFAETVASTEDYRQVSPTFIYEAPPRPVWVMRCAHDACSVQQNAIYRIIPDRRQADRQLWRLGVPDRTNLITVTPDEPFGSFDAATTAAANHHLERQQHQAPADDRYRQFRTEAYQFLELLTTC